MLSTLQQSFKLWHEKSSYLHTKYIFILAKLGFLQARFLNMKDDVPLFVPWIFGTARRMQCRTKGKKPGSIIKDTYNKLGSTRSVYQLQLSHPGFVPQFSGKITSACISNFQVMLLILATSAWGLSELWGGGIPTLGISHSTPRLWRLKLHFTYSLCPTFFFFCFWIICFPFYFLPPPHPQPFIFKSLSSKSCWTISVNLTYVHFMISTSQY